MMHRNFVVNISVSDGQQKENKCFANLCEKFDSVSQLKKEVLRITIKKMSKKCKKKTQPENVFKRYAALH